MKTESAPPAVVPGRSWGQSVARALVLATLLSSAGFCAVAYGDSFEVNTLDGGLGDGVCDGVHCSLWDAITEANSHAGADTITFDAALSGTISLTTELPAISLPLGNGTVIRAHRTPGSVSPDITVDGNFVMSRGFLLDKVDRCEIQGLRITECGIGVLVESVIANPARYNLIGGPDPDHQNLIDHDTTGVCMQGEGCEENTILNNLVAKNYRAGILLTDGACSNTVEQNVCAENEGHGICLGGVLLPVDENRIIKNIAGRDFLTAMAYGGNLGCGIYVSSESSTAASNAVADNIASDNFGHGIYLLGGGTYLNVLTGNTVGLDPTETLPYGNSLAGIHLAAGAYDNTIGSGNIVSGNDQAGILIGEDAPGNTVEDCTVGLNAAEDMAVPNGGHGIAVINGASDTRILNCRISGNTQSGVRIFGLNTRGVTVAGCLIGTDGTGMAALPNGSGAADGGVKLEGGAQECTIGPHNVIAGHSALGQFGVGLFDNLTFNNQVAENLIGLNAAGTAALPNQDGVQLATGAAYNTIGSGNVISGNLQHGIHVTTGYDSIPGNIIGADPTGTLAFPNMTGICVDGDYVLIGGQRSLNQGNLIGGNQGWGIEVHRVGPAPLEGLRVFGNDIGLTRGSPPDSLGNGAGGVWLGSNVVGARVGDYASGMGSDVSNIIAWNGGAAGVLIGETAAFIDPHSNVVLTNAIYANHGNGIDIDRFAPHYGNNNIPEPSVTVWDGITIAGVTNLTPLLVSLVQVFYDDYEEGRVFIGETNSAAGSWSLSPGISIPDDVLITATNTADYARPHNTSEFSAPVSRTGVEGEPELPIAFDFRVVGPNPSSGNAVFSFAAPRPVSLRTEVYGVEGRLVRELVNEHLAAGVYALSWDGRNSAGVPVAPGVYLVKAVCDGYERVQRVTLVR